MIYLLEALKAVADHAGYELALTEMEEIRSFKPEDLNQIRLMCGELSMKIHTMKNEWSKVVE